jgi:predicted nucleic acid-binding protein
MTPRFGIDTSILVRLVTAEPADSFRRCLERLTTLVENDDAEIVASGIVISEAYVALQHHYGVTKEEARAGLTGALTSGLVTPLNRKETLSALKARGGSGLVDRLIAIDYVRTGHATLTLDRRMARLKGARLL